LCSPRATIESRPASALKRATSPATLDRIAEEVLAIPSSPAGRPSALRGALEPRFLKLFGHRLAAPGRALPSRADELDDAVGLYQMALEGVVFMAAELALIELLENAPLPGLRSGVELVLRDERWHVGLGARCLLDAQATPHAIAKVLAEGQTAAWCWVDATGPEIAAHVAALLRRRMGAIGPP
jgi:ribonucleoside-diphosphate reductase beta chain